MSMIRTLRIEGFKSIHSEVISLGRVNCFIGENGAGKSNVLEALGVLGAAANGVVDDESLLRRGLRAGLPRLYKSSFASERTPAHIGMAVEGEAVKVYRGPVHAGYSVTLLNPLDSPEPAWSYKTEVLTDGIADIVSVGMRNGTSKLNLNPKAGLAALKLVDLAPTNPAAQLMQRLQDYAIYSPNTLTLRGVMPDVQSRAPVGLNGGLLAEGFEALRKHLGSGPEALLDEVLELVDRHMNKSRNALTAYDASEGALNVIFCALLCLLPQAPRLLAIDNLDQALNPRLLTRLTARLSGWLRHNDPDRQLLFTAHNPAVLDGLDLLDPEIRLFAVERNSHGLTCVRRIELTAELAALHAQYPLSRLWLMGHLGALPNV